VRIVEKTEGKQLHEEFCSLMMLNEILESETCLQCRINEYFRRKTITF